MWKKMTNDYCIGMYESKLRVEEQTQEWNIWKAWHLRFSLISVMFQISALIVSTSSNACQSKRSDWHKIQWFQVFHALVLQRQIFKQRYPQQSVLESHNHDFFNFFTHKHDPLAITWQNGMAKGLANASRQAAIIVFF